MKLLSSLILATVLSFSLNSVVFAKNTAKSATAKQSVQQSTAINLNKAGAKEIAKALKGVGMKKAQAIVNYRKQHGDFKAVEELASVKGIGVATIAKNHDRILLK